MWLRFGDTLQPNFLPGSCWQHHIGHLYLRQFIYYFSGFVTQTVQFTKLGQAFPQDIGQKADQDMGLNSEGKTRSVSLVETTLSIKSGERTVVGVSKLNGGDKALILILSGSVVK